MGVAGWAARILPLLYAVAVLIASARDAPWRDGAGFVLVMMLILMIPAMLAWLMVTRFFPDRPGFVVLCQLFVFSPPFLISLGVLPLSVFAGAVVYLLLLFPLFQIAILIIAIFVGRAVFAGQAETAKVDQER